MISLFERVENIVGNGENAFTPFSTMFHKSLTSIFVKKPSFLWQWVKSAYVVQMFKYILYCSTITISVNSLEQ